MRPQLIDGRLMLPMAAEAGMLNIGDKFKVREAGALHEITGTNGFGWRTARKCKGKGTLRLTENFPVIHFF